MAGSWIKMRAALRDKPEVIRIARHLNTHNGFRSWMRVEGTGARYAALRTVTLGALLLVWSNARENGVFRGDDLFLVGLELIDLDEMACPGIGEAMGLVGWAVQSKEGVTLPRFKTYNVPMDAAERQAAYRERRYGALRESNGHVTTKPLPERETETENKSPPKPPPGGASFVQPARKRQRPLTPEEAVAASKGEFK